MASVKELTARVEALEIKTGLRQAEKTEADEKQPDRTQATKPELKTVRSS